MVAVVHGCAVIAVVSLAAVYATLLDQGDWPLSTLCAETDWADLSVCTAWEEHATLRYVIMGLLALIAIVMYGFMWKYSRKCITGGAGLAVLSAPSWRSAGSAGIGGSVVSSQTDTSSISTVSDSSRSGSSHSGSSRSSRSSHSGGGSSSRSSSSRSSLSGGGGSLSGGGGSLSGGGLSLSGGGLSLSGGGSSLSGGGSSLSGSSSSRRSSSSSSRRQRKHKAAPVGRNACVLCGKSLEGGLPFLNPATCFAKYGRSRAHRICERCWFGKFALEDAPHECPGCQADIAFPPPVPSPEAWHRAWHDEVL